LDAGGVLGELITVPAGLERAVEAVLGPLLDALVVSGAHLADAVERAEAESTDLLVVPTLPASGGHSGLPGARSLADLISAPAWLKGTVEALCDETYVADSAAEARELSARHPHATVVTPLGRVLRGRGVSKPAVTREPGLA